MTAVNQHLKVNLWYDAAGDYLDVSWGTGNGYYTATADARALALVDLQGQVLGFKIDGVSAVKGKPLRVDLSAVKPAAVPA